MNDSDFLNSFEDIDISPLLRGVRVPKVKLSKKILDKYGIDENADSLKILQSLVNYGFKQKMPLFKKTGIDIEEYKKRAKYEVDVLSKLDFIDYFILVFDLVDYMIENNIPFGRGRGSCVGSFCLYLMDITSLDPLEHGLYFERFISETRAKKQIIDGVIYIDGATLPDIDIDISGRERYKAIDYLKSKFKGRIASTSNISTFTGKVLIKDCSKVIANATEEEAQFLSNQLERKYGIVDDIESVYKENPQFKEWIDKNPDVLEVAAGLKDLIRNKSQHASSVLLSTEEMTDVCPLNLDSENNPISAFDMTYATKLFLKLDLLGLKTITIISDAAKTAGINYHDIDVTDYATIYSHLQDLKKPLGLFQIEGSATLGVLREVKPKTLGELSAVIAISRPGTISFKDQYAKYNNTGVCESIDPLLDDKLKDTGGCIIFQESIMQIANEVFGMPLHLAYDFLKFIAKKKVEDIPKWKGSLYEYAEKNKVPTETTDLFWKTAEASANYAFNKSIFLEEKVETQNGEKIINNIIPGDFVKAFNTKTGLDHFVEVLDVDRHDAILYKFEFNTKNSFRCSMEHKVLTEEAGMVAIKECVKYDYNIICDGGFCRVVSYEKMDEITSIDLEVDHSDHNFYCNNIVVSNSHSSSYSVVTAQTTYLKFNHPLAFFLAELKMAREEADLEKIGLIQKELVSFNIQLLPPHLVKSQEDFSIEGNNIRYGLGSLRGVSSSSKKIKQLDCTGDKLDIFDMAKEAGLNIGVLSALIQAGCLEDLGSRPRVILEACTYNILTDKEKEILRKLYKKGVDKDVLGIIKHMSQIPNPDSKKKKQEEKDVDFYIKPSRFEKIKEKYAGYKEIYLKNKANSDLASYIYEVSICGFSFSQSLASIFNKKNPNVMTIREILNSKDKYKNKLGVGRVLDIVKKKAKSGLTYVRITVEDETARTELLVFESDRAANVTKIIESNNGKLPSEHDLIMFSGKSKDDGAIFVEDISVQSAKVYMRLADLK